MDEKISAIKEWVGVGSIDIFGLPMSGKDTQGIRLAEAIDGKLISSGMIVRAHEEKMRQKYSDKGHLIPSNVFYEWVLPYLEREDLKEFPLVLSSIGRWSGEEDKVMETAANSGHKMKAVILINISESAVEKRFEAARILAEKGEDNDRGTRADDRTMEIFRTRLQEFRIKTMPVIEHYRNLGLLIMVHGDQTREAVFTEIVDKLYQKAQAKLD